MSLDFLGKADLQQALKEAMKKQHDDLHADFEKLQTKFVARVRKVIHDEIRQITEAKELLEKPTARAVVEPEEESKSREELKASAKKRRSRRRSTRVLSSFDANPFKNLHAKLNDADDLEDPESMEPITDIFNRQISSSNDVAEMTPERVDNSTNDNSKRDLQRLETGREELENPTTARSVTEGDEIVLASNQREDAALVSPEPGESKLPLLKKEAATPELRTLDGIKSPFAVLLKHPIFEGLVVCFVILNALWIGADLEYKLTVSDVRPAYFTIIDIIFCALFLCELLIRVSAFGKGFFDPRLAQWAWNYFDLILVLSQIAELVCRYYEPVRGVANGKSFNVSWLRTLRILRIVRLTRIVRAVRFIEGLRTLMKCLVNGMTATGWVAFFLLMQVYTFGLAFTELLHEMRLSHKEQFAKGGELDLRFGSLSVTMKTLIKSFTGGIAWGDALDPLNQVSPPLGFAFVLFVSFSLLVILNIFTGFFVNTSSACAAEDRKKILRDRLADVFVVEDNNRSDSIVDEELFSERVNSPEMKTYFNEIDLHVDEAEGLFKILDLDGEGELNPIEIVSGLMRMTGSAKALDVRMLMYVVTKIQEYNHEHLMRLEKTLIAVKEKVQTLQKDEPIVEDGQLEGGELTPLSPVTPQSGKSMDKKVGFARSKSSLGAN